MVRKTHKPESLGESARAYVNPRGSVLRRPERKLKIKPGVTGRQKSPLRPKPPTHLLGEAVRPVPGQQSKAVGTPKRQRKPAACREPIQGSVGV